MGVTSLATAIVQICLCRGQRVRVVEEAHVLAMEMGRVAKVEVVVLVGLAGSRIEFLWETAKYFAQQVWQTTPHAPPMVVVVVVAAAVAVVAARMLQT